MQDRPAVSIALATYNGARFLKAQLESLAAQTLQPCELVVGDDCSSDDTIRILEAFAATAPFPVRIERNPERLDFGENFLRTAMRCSGEYVAFCDQDDVWLPHKIETSVEAMVKHGAVLCAHDAVIVDEDLNKVGEFTGGERAGLHPPLTMKPWGVFFGFTMTFRRDLLTLVPLEDRPPDQFRPGRKLAHDRWIYFLAGTLGETIYLGEPLALYRQHPGNTFGATNAMNMDVLRDRVRIAAAEQVMQEESARRKAEVLQDVAEKSLGRLAELARAGSVYWERMAQIYGRRGEVATREGLPRRLHAIGQLMAFGGYASPAKGGLSVRAFAKDVLVAFGPRGGEPPTSPESVEAEAPGA